MLPSLFCRLHRRMQHDITENAVGRVTYRHISAYGVNSPVRGLPLSEEEVEHAA